MADDPVVEVRLDKWLWAARFFKTRSVAQQAIRGGKVVINGQRAKPARGVRAGDRLVATATIDAVRTVAGNDMLTTRVDLATEDGEPVCTTHSMLVARGTA